VIAVDRYPAPPAMQVPMPTEGCRHDRSPKRLKAVVRATGPIC